MSLLCEIKLLVRLAGGSSDDFMISKSISPMASDSLSVTIRGFRRSGCVKGTAQRMADRFPRVCAFLVLVSYQLFSRAQCSDDRGDTQCRLERQNRQTGHVESNLCLRLSVRQSLGSCTSTEVAI